MPFEGENIIYYPTCCSTNTVARELVINSQLPEGTVIITDCQLQGRGQRGNTWISSPYQNLTFSLIFYPTWLGLGDIFSLNMATALGIYQTLAAYVPQGIAIKWPNDMYYQNKKVGGILIENVVAKNELKASLIGIGLNVNQTNFNSLLHTTSLSLISGYKFNLSSLLLQLTDNIQRQYDRLRQEVIESLQKDYLQYLYGLHEIKNFRDQEGSFQGIIQGIDKQGRLVVDRASGERRYYNNQEIKLVL